MGTKFKKDLITWSRPHKKEPKAIDLSLKQLIQKDYKRELAFRMLLLKIAVSLILSLILSFLLFGG